MSVTADPQVVAHYDVLIVGGGMVGAAAACLLGQAGLSVLLLEQQAPRPFAADQPLDRRVSAISPASVALIQACGAWPALQAMRLRAYRRLETWELEGHETRFSAAELGVSELGFIVENRLIQLALWQQLQTLPNVEFSIGSQWQQLESTPGQAVLTLADGRRVAARLVLGADGAHSRVRQQAGIGVTQWDYRQACLLVNVELDDEAPEITWQQFHPSGPRAFLPLAGRHASLVWYDTPERVAELRALPPAALLAAIRGHFPARLPACRVQGADSFTLTRRHAQRYVAGRVVLLGDAAHTIHPLAGQGVNLGFKDVELLCQLIASAYQAGEAWDAPALLARYQRQRQRDNLLMQTAMDAFYWAFSNQLPPLRLLRNAGLLLADRAGPLKRRALRYALGL